MAESTSQDGKLGLIIGAALTALLSITGTFDDHNTQIIVNSLINLATKIGGIAFGISIIVDKETAPVSEIQGAVSGPILLAAVYALGGFEAYPWTHWAVVLVFTGLADEMLSTIGGIFESRMRRQANRQVRRQVKKRLNRRR